MNIMLIKANEALYASKGLLNEALFQMSCNILGEHHQIQVTDTAQAYGTSTTKFINPAKHQ